MVLGTYRYPPDQKGMVASDRDRTFLFTAVKYTVPAASDGTADIWNTSSRHRSSAASFRLMASPFPGTLFLNIVSYHKTGFFVKGHPIAAAV